MADKKAYYVGIQIYNTFYIEADSKENAENQVRELDCYATLDGCDLNIADITEITWENNDE
tara:strand:+ start:1893 stop:2075 length:183 start_codon:yes stop_codon:yes gene_type:complete